MAKINLGKVVPEKGVDYFTDAEKNQLKQDIEDDIGQRLTTDETQINKNSQDIVDIYQKIDSGSFKSDYESLRQDLNNTTLSVNVEPGKLLTLKNTAAARLKNFKLNGATTQKTRSGKNLLYTTFPIIKSMNVNGTWNDNNVYTYNGLTYTVNSDFSITVNGTSSDSTIFYLTQSSLALEVGTYTFTGCPAQSGTDYYIEIYRRTPASYPKDYGSGQTLEITDNTQRIQAYIVINSGVTVNNIVFYPMIRLSSVTDNTYEPYGVSPSPDYSSPIINIEPINKFSGWIKGIGLNSDTGEAVAWGSHAVSDYIPVDFNTNLKYCLSGLTNTLHNLIGAYNAQKQFLGRTRASNTSARVFNKYEFTAGIPQGTGDIAYIRVDHYWTTGDTGTVDAVDTLETQLEIGNKKTEYIPYNNIEVYFQNKNFFNMDSNIVFNNRASNEVIANGNRIICNEAIMEENQVRYCVFQIKNSDKLLGKTVVLSGNMAASASNSTRLALFGLDSSNRPIYSFGSIYESGQLLMYLLNEFPEGVVSIGIVEYACWQSGSASVGDYVDYTNVQLEISNAATDWEKYAIKKYYFPLEPGQHLMQGSYLADDGIHNTRKQIVLDGSSDENWVMDKELTNSSRFYTGPIIHGKNDFSICNRFVNDTITRINNIDSQALTVANSAQIVLRLNKSYADTLEAFKTWLFNNPITVEYKLLEDEELIPYTGPQQEAWNNITRDSIYKGVTNISTIADVNPVIEATGIMDLESILENLDARITVLEDE